MLQNQDSEVKTIVCVVRSASIGQVMSACLSSFTGKYGIIIVPSSKNSHED